MAIRELASSVGRARESVSTTRRRLSLVAPLSQLSHLSVASLTDAKRDSKNFVMICVAIATAGLMTMFGLNIALTEGAFTVRALKLEVIEMKELRQAALTELAHVSSPERLAQSAQMLGMVPSGKPRFIEIENR